MSKSSSRKRSIVLMPCCTAKVSRNDITIALETVGEENFQALSSNQTETLILGGTKSPAYLQRSTHELEKILPNSTRVEFKGLDHDGTFNKALHGSPEVFARELKRFFSEGNTSGASKED